MAGMFARLTQLGRAWHTCLVGNVAAADPIGPRVRARIEIALVTVDGAACPVGIRSVVRPGRQSDRARTRARFRVRGSGRGRGKVLAALGRILAHARYGNFLRDSQSQTGSVAGEAC